MDVADLHQAKPRSQDIKSSNVLGAMQRMRQRERRIIQVIEAVQ